MSTRTEFLRVPPELLLRMSRFMARQEVTTFRSLVRPVAAVVNALEFFSRFYVIFRELRMCGDDFALMLVRAREDKDSWESQLAAQQSEGNGMDKNLRYYFAKGIREKDVTVLNWCLDTVSRHVQSNHYTWNEDFVSALQNTVKLGLRESVTTGWYLGIRLTMEALYHAWLAEDERNETVVPYKVGARLSHIASVMVAVEGPISEYFLSYSLSKFDAYWNSENICVFLAELGKAPDADLAGRVAQTLLKQRHVEFDMRDVRTVPGYVNILRPIIWKDDVALADIALALFPRPVLDNPRTSHVLFAMAKYAAERSFLRVATHVTSLLEGSWAREYLPNFDTEIWVVPIAAALAALNSDAGDVVKQVGKSERNATLGPNIV
jgi:hypothetical protein